MQFILIIAINNLKGEHFIELLVLNMQNSYLLKFQFVHIAPDSSMVMARIAHSSFAIV